MVKSPKTGAYIFDEQMVRNEDVQNFFKKYPLGARTVPWKKGSRCKWKVGGSLYFRRLFSYARDQYHLSGKSVFIIRREKLPLQFGCHHERLPLAGHLGSFPLFVHAVDIKRQGNNMQRLLLYVHYNKFNFISGHVLYQLENIRPLYSRVVFISNSQLPEDCLLYTSRCV